MCPSFFSQGIPMSETKTEKPESSLETWVGLMVVITATFLGISNVKDNNIVQKMQQKQVDQNNNWAWFQARNIRMGVYEAASEEMSLPNPGETPEQKTKREAMSAKYAAMAKSQEQKMEAQKQAAEQASKDYDDLNSIDDKFDLCDALLALSMALMGVTALIKRWWLFFLALFPFALGFYIGIACFAGFDVKIPFLESIMNILS